MADGQTTENNLTLNVSSVVTGFNDSMDDVIDKFTNVTIGEVDYTKVEDDILFILRERKQKRQACNKDSLMKDCLQRLNIDEGTFTHCITHLLNKQLISVVSRAGKLIYTPATIEVTDANTSDFVDFKRYVCEKLKELDQKIKSKNELICNLGNIIDTKDSVINLLREELKSTRELFEKSLDKIVCFGENHHCVTKEKSSLTDDQIKKLQHADKNMNELTILPTLITPAEKLLTPKVIKEKSVQLITDQLIAVRLKKHNDFLTSNNINKNNNKIANDTFRESAINKLESNINVSEVDPEIKLKEQISNSQPKQINYTAILGDSMINGINANGFRKDLNVKIKPFGGATSADLIDHIKPTLRKKPKNIILHVGTNDLTNNIDTIPNLKSIIKLARTESPNSTVAISNVVIRTDKKNMIEKVNELNKKIDELCRKESIEVINNSNLKDTHLSKRKLHLNQKGLSILAKNFITYLN